MPQINVYTYLSQTTWTIILFIFFYFFIKQFVLPYLFQFLFLLPLLSKKTTITSEKNHSPYRLPSIL